MTCLDTWTTDDTGHTHVCAYPDADHSGAQGPCICACGSAAPGWWTHDPRGPHDPCGPLERPLDDARTWARLHRPDRHLALEAMPPAADDTEPHTGAPLELPRARQRAWQTNPRQHRTNPRALGANPRARRRRRHT